MGQRASGEDESAVAGALLSQQLEEDVVHQAFVLAQQAEQHARTGSAQEAAQGYCSAISLLRQRQGSSHEPAIQAQVAHCEERQRLLAEEVRQQADPDRKECNFAKTVNELLRTERTYNEDLRNMKLFQEAINESLERLGPPVISLNEADTLFGELDSLIAHSDSLKGGLEGSSGQWTQIREHIMRSMEGLGVVYARYLGGDVNDLINHLETKNLEFQKLVAKVQERHQLKKLSSYTITPVQRAPRYRLLLESMLKYSRGESAAEIEIQRALHHVHEAILRGEQVRDERERKRHLPRINDLLMQQGVESKGTLVRLGVLSRLPSLSLPSQRCGLPSTIGYICRLWRSVITQLGRESGRLETRHRVYLFSDGSFVSEQLLDEQEARVEYGKVCGVHRESSDSLGDDNCDARVNIERAILRIRLEGGQQGDRCERMEAENAQALEDWVNDLAETAIRVAMQRREAAESPRQPFILSKLLMVVVMVLASVGVILVTFGVPTSISQLKLCSERTLWFVPTASREQALGSECGAFKQSNVGRFSERDGREKYAGEDKAKTTWKRTEGVSARHEHEGECRLLLDKPGGQSGLEGCLHRAAAQGQLDLVVRLLDDVGQGLWERGRGGDTIMHAAARSGNTKLMKELMRREKKLLMEVNDRGESCLDAAVRANKAKMVEMLLATGPWELKKVCHCDGVCDRTLVRRGCCCL